MQHSLVMIVLNLIKIKLTKLNSMTNIYIFTLHENILISRGSFYLYNYNIRAIYMIILRTDQHYVNGF